MKIFATLLFALLVTVQGQAEERIEPQIVKQFIQKVKSNENWKVAVVTGEQGQVVIMNISPGTNPKNQISEEVHHFDQVSLIIEGRGKAIVGDKTSIVGEGDMLFIPKGVDHTVINLNSNKPLKLISFYSENDIPKGSVYKTISKEEGK